MIGNYAFFGCTSITALILPDGITDIGYAAFAYDESLSSINIPSSVTRISAEAFRGTALISVNIPDGVTYIGNGAFA